MEILLIRPPIVVPKSNMVVQYTPPIGLAYLGGSLRTAGHNVQIIDGLGEDLDAKYPVENECFLHGLTIDEVVSRINCNVEVIGVSAAFSFEWPTCRNLIAGIKERFPQSLIIGGGEHITALPEESLKDSELDIGVLGEGEEVTLRLIDELEKTTRQLEKVNGIVFKEGNSNIRRTQGHSRIKDIDSISLPAWDLIPIENYLDRQLGFGVNRGRSMPVLASRGCPFQCTFCSNPKMWTTRWVARDTDLLLDELAYYQEKYQITNFDFYDLTAIVKKSWIIEFCEKIEIRGMQFTWQLPSGSRSEAIDMEVARMLYQSGCRNLSFAPESGSLTVLKRIKKKITPERMLRVMRDCINTGVNIKANIIFGFQGETIREILESYGFIVKMAWAGVHDVSIWAFSPYPGSEDFDSLYNNGEIKLNDAFYDKLRSYSDNSNPKSYSEYIGDRELRFLRIIGTLIFYLVSWLRYPNRPFIIIRNVFSGKQESRGELVLQRRLRSLLRRRHRLFSG